MDLHNAVGEGSYGCVVKPALHCNNDNTPPPINYVSKIMKTDNAEEEIDEIDEIDAIDPQFRFHLPRPKLCKISRSRNYESTVKGCTKIKLTKHNLQNHSILTMPDAGSSLNDIGMKYASVHPDNAEGRAYIYRVWLSLMLVFKGVVRMGNKKYAHSDLNDNNIMFDNITTKSVMIDFGLGCLFKDIKDGYKYDTTVYTKVHWSYPPEILYTSIDAYSNINHYVTPTAHTLKPILETLHTYSFFDKNKPSINFPKQYLQDSIAWSDQWFDDRAMNDTFSGDPNDENQVFEHYSNDKTYKTFVDTHIKKFDVYGLGIGCFILLMGTYHLIDKSFSDDLASIFYQMINPNLDIRYTAEKALDEYTKCLKTHKLTARSRQNTPNLPTRSTSPIRHRNKLSSRRNHCGKSIKGNCQYLKPGQVADPECKINIATKRCHKISKVKIVKTRKLAADKSRCGTSAKKRCQYLKPGQAVDPNCIINIATRRCHKPPKAKKVKA